jgi:small multidrug resistance pump
MPWIYLMIAIVGEVIGTSTLKSAAGFTRFWPSATVVAGYAVAFFFLVGAGHRPGLAHRLDSL